MTEEKQKELLEGIIEMANNIIICSNELTTGNVSHNKKFLENGGIKIKTSAKKLLYKAENDSKKFPYNINVGDTIAHVSNDAKNRGELISVIVTEELLNNILKYETTENYHQFRIMKKFNEI